MRELAAGGATPRLEDVGQDHQFGLSEPSNVVPRWADRYLVSMLDCVDAASEMWLSIKARTHRSEGGSQ